SLLDIEVIAEGVEEKKHYKILKKLGCKYFQGYYFAYPRSIEEIKQTFHLQN
ncbi:MAG: EAL domain-containing protein, partial [Epsilonproteobacteria bacterium]|nr:EAL domain-containing protein [Campylobacterota bacterium]